MFKKGKMKYKAIITDIDHTAIDSPDKKEASSRLVAAINRLESLGIKVTAATGRAKTWAKPAIESMELRHPVIIAGGTQIVDPKTFDIKWQSTITKQRLKLAIEIIKKHGYKVIWNDYSEDDYMAGGQTADKVNLQEDINVLEIPFVPTESLEAFLSELKTIPGLIVIDMRSWREGKSDVHITNEDASKEHAIYVLEKMIGVEGSGMIGVGDSGNDVPIFKAVSHKVAMGNATSQLKELADEVIGDVKDDGLAVYFERLIQEVENEI